MADGTAYRPGDAELDDDQEAVVRHDGGDLVVLAGAGSGKTRCMEHRVAHVLERDDVHPRRVAAVGFTNEASSELCRRIADLHPDGRKVISRTLHSLCYLILREERPVDGVLDTGDACGMIRSIFGDVRWGHEDGAGFALSAFDAARAAGNRREDVPDWLESQYPDVGSDLVEVWHAYDGGKRDRGVVDFMDMIWRTVEMLRFDDEVRERVRGQFRHLIVDECQDLTPLQLGLIDEMAEPGYCTLCLVGDVRQSIYGFRGADPDRLAEVVESRGMEVYHLRRNYRSAPEIVGATNELMDGRDPGGLESPDAEAVREAGGSITHKVLSDDFEEARWVAEDIKRAVEGGTRADDIGVLYRTNAQSQCLQVELSTRKIPFQVVRGRSFFERPEVRQATAYLSLVEDGTDAEALEEVYATPTRYLGSEFIERFRIMHREGDLVTRTARRVEDSGYGNAYAVGHLTADVGPLVNWMGPGSHPSDVLEYVYGLRSRVDETRTFKTLERDDDGEPDSYRSRNLEALKRMASRFDTVEAFMDRIDGGDVDSEVGRPGERVSMMTVHRSKGLEFERVYLVGATEGLLPHARADADEERRIAYVAATRAEDDLVVTTPLIKDESPSRYLSEMGIRNG